MLLKIWIVSNKDTTKIVEMKPFKYNTRIKYGNSGVNTKKKRIYFCM